MGPRDRDAGSRSDTATCVRGLLRRWCTRLGRRRRAARSATVAALAGHGLPPEMGWRSHYPAYGWRLRSIWAMRSHGGRDGRWIRCAASGHCQWIARTSVAAARTRLFEASRGPLPGGARLEHTCGEGRCVNLDHLRLARGPSAVTEPGLQLCRRGHELTPTNVVRHRDGRIAYCRICRNDRRRERYREDRTYAEREIERQRRRRRT